MMLPAIGLAGLVVAAWIRGRMLVWPAGDGVAACLAAAMRQGTALPGREHGARRIGPPIAWARGRYGILVAGAYRAGVADVSDEAIDLEHFRVRLLELRAELRDAARTAGGAGDPVELDQQRQGRLSRMDALSAQAMSQAAGRRRRETLQRCEAALARIDAGDYGLCTRCDGEIDPRRLAFDPTVALCIACASAAER